jgi:hypothetical protein
LESATKQLWQRPWWLDVMIRRKTLRQESPAGTWMRGPRSHPPAPRSMSSLTPFHVLFTWGPRSHPPSPHSICFVHRGATLSSSLTPFHMFRSHGGSFSESRGPHGPVSGGTVNFGGSGTASSATPLLSACACSFFAFLIAICVQGAIKKVSKVQSRRCPRCKPHACPGARP